MFKLDRTDTPAGGEHATVYLVFELSSRVTSFTLFFSGLGTAQMVFDPLRGEPVEFV